MLRAFLLVGLGGFAGSILRYATSLAINKYNFVHLPLATLTVNLLGCFAIGLISGYAQRNTWLSLDGWLILATGLCGGFTTFSAFALENTSLMQKGLNMSAVVYTAISVIGGIIS